MAWRISWCIWCCWLGWARWCWAGRGCRRDRWLVPRGRALAWRRVTLGREHAVGHRLICFSFPQSIFLPLISSLVIFCIYASSCQLKILSEMLWSLQFSIYLKVLHSIPYFSWLIFMIALSVDHKLYWLAVFSLRLVWEAVGVIRSSAFDSISAEFMQMCWKRLFSVRPFLIIFLGMIEVSQGILIAGQRND